MSRRTMGLVAAALLCWLMAYWPPGAASPPPAEPVLAGELAGQQLFVLKGCVQCHQHEAIAQNSTLNSVGPVLTDYGGEAAYLRKWLAEPEAIKPGTLMPNLPLSAQEINQLSAFLLAD